MKMKMKVVVAEIKNHEGEVTYDVIDAKAAGEKNKEMQAAYRDALKEYNSLSGDEKANAKKPVKPALKKRKTFTDVQKAEQYATELQRKYREKNKE